MSRYQTLILGVLIGFVIAACTSIAQYPHYVIDVPNAIFRGKTAADDIPFSTCNPTSTNKAPCIMMYIDEYAQVLKDIADLNDRLIACEGVHP